MFKRLGKYWQRRRDRFYGRNRWHLVLDISALVAALVLIVSASALFLYRPAVWPITLGGFSARPPLDLNNPPLDLDFSLVGQEFEAGQPAIIKISGSNNGVETAKGLRISFALAGSDFSLTRLEADDDAVKIEGRTFYFGDIGPSSSRSVTISAYFSPRQEGARKISWQALAEYGYRGEILSETKVLPEVYLTAHLRLSAAAYYTSPQGDQLGVGPLPPRVGQPTNYWIFWDAKSAGDFRGLVVSAKLPLGVEPTGAQSLLAGELKYNPSNRQLIWKVPELRGPLDAYRAGFEVQFIPTANELGKTVSLLGDLQYYSVDSISGREEQGSLDNLTTNLDFDRFNKGQGKVEE